MVDSVLIIEAQHPYKYTDDTGAVISFKQGERFILINKSNEDWWKVQRTGVFSGKSVCYVPASYMKEVTINPPSGQGGQYRNQYVNLDVYKKIISKDFDGLARLGNTSMVVSKDLVTSEKPQVTVSSSNNDVDEIGDDDDNDIDDDDDGDDDEEDDDNDCAFLRTSLDDIPDDIRKYNHDDASDYSASSPSSPLSFEISPRQDRMKSFTLPSGWKKCTEERSGRPFYLNEGDNKKTWKPPRPSISDTKREAPLKPPTPPPQPEIPNGWTTDIDPKTNNIIYVNNTTKEKWMSCADHNGKTYFYNLNGKESSWKLPIVDNNANLPRQLRRKSFDETLDGLIRRQTMSNRSPSNRDSKCQSVVYTSPSSLSSEDSGNTKSPITSPIASPRHLNKQRPISRAKSEHSFEKIEGLAAEAENEDAPNEHPFLEGYLYRRKVMEATKLVKKAAWQQLYCCQFGSSLVFYKDQKSAMSKPGFPSGKPESSLNLLGAALDHVSKEKAKGKKNVFQVSTYGGQHIFQFVADSEVEMASWITSIQTTIKQLEIEEPLPPPPPSIELPDGNLNTVSPLAMSPTPDFPALPVFSPVTAGAKPTTPSIPKKLMVPGEKEKSGFKGFKRTFSKKVLTSNDDEKDKTKMKDKLRKFLVRRPTYSDLEKNGIIKDYVFGCHMSKLCEHEDSEIPKIIIQLVNEVERRGLTTDGLYRVSGNLSAVNKLRVMVDHDEYVDLRLPEWNDVHLLTGAIKLYFRELPEPLIPFKLFGSFMNAIKNPFKPDKIKKLQSVIEEMPYVNKATLEFIIMHLVRVMAHSAKNRMHSQNLAIVFGPTLLWPEVESLNMAMTTVYQNQVVEFLLVESQHFFPEYV